MNALVERVAAHIAKAQSYEARLADVLRFKTLEIVRLKGELARLERLETAIRNMGELDPAVRQLLRFLDGA